MDNEEQHTQSGHKKRKRHRKKQLFNTILKQMEFYFSDAALIKDRFLSQLINNDPFVPLEVFLTFNKIKALTSKTGDIVAALQDSKLLQLSQDHTKVRRVTPLVPYDVDSRTIYVESIPYTANIEWITSIFQTYGSVAYVSLPKFYKTNRIKGFAFVEFEKEEDAKKCLDSFIEMGCKMATNIKAETLASCQGLQPDIPDPNICCDEDRGHLSDDKQEEPPHKKLKIDNDGDKDVIIHSKNEAAEESATEHSESANEQENCRSEDVSRTINPSRKRKKKDKKKSHKEREKKNLDICAKNLQVLSKCEWKVLRNKYLEMQRKHMKSLKQVLKTQHTVLESACHIPNRNAGISDQGSATAKTNQKLTEISFVEGVIAKVQLEEPCINVKEFKKATKLNVSVVFVDVKEGESNAYVRLKSWEAAKEFASSGIFPEISILKGKDEKDYWELIKKHQYEKATSKRKIRGRDRLVNKATQLVESINQNISVPSKHIRFDE